MTDIADKPKVGLILAGGGARAAYQVGVLKAIAEMLPPDCPNPFPILSGTSAGAINATTSPSAPRGFTKACGVSSVWQIFTWTRFPRIGVLANGLLVGHGGGWTWAPHTPCSTAPRCVACFTAPCPSPESRNPSMPALCMP
jgi:hypothetical protein